MMIVTFVVVGVETVGIVTTGRYVIFKNVLEHPFIIIGVRSGL